MEWLLNLIPGGSATATLGAILGTVILAIGAGWKLLASAKKAGINEQKAKEAKARDQNLDRIKRAADARPAGGLSDDPNNRDNR